MVRKCSKLVCVVLVSLLWGFGCSDDTETGGQQSCADGQQFNVLSGECEAVNGSNDTGTEAQDGGPDSSSTDSSSTDTSADTGSEDDTDDGTCSPGERRCVDDWTLATCNNEGSGFNETSCANGSVCREGRCEVAEGVCTPGRTSCEGNDVVRCNDDGESTTVVETCAGGEMCQNGSCVPDVGPCANQKGYLGCEFLAADLDHMDPGDDQQFGISVSNSHTGPVEVTITTGDGTQVAQQTIPAGQLETFELARRDVDNTGLTRQSYIVETTGPVTVHQFNPLNRSGVASTDASLLLPSHAIGTDYMVLGWPTTTSLRVTEGRAYFTIIAAQNDTEVTVTPSAPIEGAGGVSSIAAGQTETFTLARGQVLSLSTPNQAGYDLSGSTITSTKPVAVYSGNECADVPVGTAACDHLEQQLYPTDTWGSTLVAAKFAPRDQESDVYRLVASQDGTQISFTPAVGGTSQITLDRGGVHEFSTAEHFLVEATQPVLLGQFMVGASDGGVCSSLFCASAPGDPAFLLNVSTRQYRGDYIVLIPQGFGENFLSITAPTSASITVDGQAVSASPHTIAGTDWQVYQVPVGAGVHRVEATEPVGLTAHGYDQYVSYAYPGGMSLEVR